jgi:hypothetical protein
MFPFRRPVRRVSRATGIVRDVRLGLQRAACAIIHGCQRRDSVCVSQVKLPVIGLSEVRYLHSCLGGCDVQCMFSSSQNAI